MNKEHDLETIKKRFDSYLPEFILKAPYLKEIFNSEITESYHLNRYIKKLLNELAISTVTEDGIDKWEILAGLKNENLSLEERIDSVIKKFSYQVHANYFNFLTMLKTYDAETELKEFINEYRIEIKTKNYISYNDFLNYLSIINNYKPAHIGVLIKILRKENIVMYIGIASNRCKKSKVYMRTMLENKFASARLFVGVGVNRFKKSVILVKPTYRDKIAASKIFLGVGVKRKKDSWIIVKDSKQKAILNTFVVGNMRVGGNNDNI